MPQSYENRYTAKEREEIRNDLALLGESPTAEHWGATIGPAFHEFSTRLLGREPEFATKFAHSDASQLAHFIVADLLARLQAKDESIHQLREQLAAEHRMTEAADKRVKFSAIHLMNALQEAKG